MVGRCTATVGLWVRGRGVRFCTTARECVRESKRVSVSECSCESEFESNREWRVRLSDHDFFSRIIGVLAGLFGGLGWSGIGGQRFV